MSIGYAKSVEEKVITTRKTHPKRQASNDASPQTVAIRPVKGSDLDGLMTLAELSGAGFSSLQPDRKFLAKYIKASVSAFAASKADVPQKFLLVMTASNGKIIGCSAVKTGVGLDQPFVNFDLSGVGDAEYLQASNRFDGATEVGSLFLHPDYRAFGLGRYLAKIRYLLMAAAPQIFNSLVIAELRGVLGQEGSPFYNHFFRDRLECSFEDADEKYAASTPEQLALISPIGKIYTDELPLEVKEVIGHPHPAGRGALNLLMDEGFLFSGSIDLFDAGPIVSVHRDTIRTARESRIMPMNIGKSTTSNRVMLASTHLSDFRAVITSGDFAEDFVTVSVDAAKAAKFKAGQAVRVWAKAGGQLRAPIQHMKTSTHV